MQWQPVFFTSTFNILAHIHKVATCVFVVALYVVLGLLCHESQKKTKRAKHKKGINSIKKGIKERSSKRWLFIRCHVQVKFMAIYDKKKNNNNNNNNIR